jgi:hypothetical protein
MIYKKHALTAMARIIRWLGSISAAWSYISDAVVTSVRPAIAFRDCRRRSASKRRSFLASAVIGEWRLSGERKYYLSILPANANLKALAATIKARLVCEQAHQQMKEELSLDHFEGRSWQGLHRHALMTMIAYAFLQHQRLKQTKREKKNQSWPTQTNSPGGPASRYQDALANANLPTMSPLPNASQDSHKNSSAKVVLELPVQKLAWAA